VNAEIRSLWEYAAGGRLSPAQEARYQELLVEWADAVRAELVDGADACPTRRPDTALGLLD
jgi:hypothetical protein